MNVVFRADANKNTGMGHIMRCLSMADAFSNAGCQVEFLIADNDVSKLINDRGYKVIILHADYKCLEDELVLWPTDLHSELIIVDSYYVTDSYLRRLREKMKSSGGKLVYIDDVYTFPYPVDILVDYNAYANDSIYESLYKETTVEKPRTVLGPLYTPLRSMFRNIPKRIQPECVQKILISTGGSDELHLAISFIRYLISHTVTNYVYHFLIGAMNSDKEEISSLTQSVENIVLHENVSDMKSLISSCDIAVSAAGSTLYEICACGVPLITFSVADNQIPGAKAFENLGLGINIGDLRDTATINPDSIVSGKLKSDAISRINSAITKLAADYDFRVEMGKRMQEVIDGYGAERLVNEIINQVELKSGADKRRKLDITLFEKDDLDALYNSFCWNNKIERQHEVQEAVMFLCDQYQEEKVFSLNCKIKTTDSFDEEAKRIHFRYDEVNANGIAIPQIFQSEEYKKSIEENADLSGKTVILINNKKLKGLPSAYYASVIVHELSHCYDYIFRYPEIYKKYGVDLKNVVRNSMADIIGGYFTAYSEMRAKYLQEMFWIKSCFCRNFLDILYKDSKSIDGTINHRGAYNIDRIEGEEDYYHIYRCVGKIRCWEEVFINHPIEYYGNQAAEHVKKIKKNYLERDRFHMIIKDMYEAWDWDIMIEKCDEILKQYNGDLSAIVFE